MLDSKRFTRHDTTFNGWLLNRASHHSLTHFFSRHWQRSWCVLANGQLHHFKHQGSTSLQGCRLVSRASNSSDNEPLGYVLEIHQETRSSSKRGSPHDRQNSESRKGSHHSSPSKPFLICTSTLLELEHWEREIRRVRGGVFGQSLEDTIINESDTCTKVIPSVVEMCVCYIRNNGIREEGIFRLNGRSSVVQELQDAFDHGEKPCFEDVSPGVHTIASLLKRYFQLLPEPIIPWRHCKYFIPIMQQLQDNEDEGRFKLIIQLALLPRINHNLLKYLCQFLHDVHRQEAYNKMGLGNLANIFAPHILRPKHAQGAFLLGSTALSLRLVHYLIQHQDKLFPPTSDIQMDYEVIEAPSPVSSLDSSGSLYERASSCEYEVEIIPQLQDSKDTSSSGDSQDKKQIRVQKSESCNYELEFLGDEYRTPADVNSIYENLDLSNGPSLIESLKNRISEMPSKPLTQSEQKAKRYGVSYRDPASIASATNVHRRHSSDSPNGKVNSVVSENSGPVLRGKKHKFQNGDVHSQIQSTYQNVKTLAISFKEQQSEACNSTTGVYQNPNPLHTALIRDLKAATTNEDDYLQPTFYKQPFPRTNGEALKPPKAASRNIQNGDVQKLSKHKPEKEPLLPPSGSKMNGKVSITNGATSQKPVPSGDTSSPSQGLRVRLKQKEEEINRQQKTMDKIRRERESLRVKLCAEEVARSAAEERCRKLQVEVDTLKRRLGIIR